MDTENELGIPNSVLARGRTLAAVVGLAPNPTTVPAPLATTAGVAGHELLRASLAKEGLVVEVVGSKEGDTTIGH